MSAIRLFYFLINVCYILAQSTVTDCPLQHPAVIKFREYLQIDTSRGENIYKAVDFWRCQAEQLGLDFRVYDPAGAPICVLTWPGANPSLPSIMLNSHMDVVHADGALWSHPPFAAAVDEDCNVVARGAQDTKDVGIQYVEAISRLKQQNVTLLRTVHVTLMPDEETGGFMGMRKFVETEEFKRLNVGFALDEGVTTPDDNLYALYQDRRAWSMNFTVRGSGGHGFQMPEDVAIAKLNKLIKIILEFRKQLREDVKNLAPLEYGPYTSINLNMINGGDAPNVIPNTFSLVADMRLGSNANATEMLALVNSWAADAGNGTTLEFLRREMESLATPVDDTNPFWTAMKEAINDMGYTVTPIVCPATSDMLFVRTHGVPALGFTPKHRTAPTLHALNEYLNLHMFLRGIDVYEAILKRIANLEI